MAIFSHFDAPGGLEIGSTPVLIIFRIFYIPKSPHEYLIYIHKILKFHTPKSSSSLWYSSYSLRIYNTPNFTAKISL